MTYDGIGSRHRGYDDQSVRQLHTLSKTEEALTMTKGGTMANLDAQIVPGRSAAGIEIGQPIAAVLAAESDLLVAEPVINQVLGDTGITRYRSPAVDLFVENGIVTEIMVHDGYRGQLMGRIGIGSTIDDIERLIGPCEEDEFDDLVITNMLGLAFEIAGSFPGLTDPAYRFAPIKEIMIVAAEPISDATPE